MFHPLTHHRVRLGLFAAQLLIAIIIPFVLLEQSIVALSDKWLDMTQARRFVHVLVVVLLLAGDIVLPVPSSILSAYAGSRFGLELGTAAVWLGMTAGCVIGYLVGRSIGHHAAQRIVGPQTWAAVSSDLARWGVWLILLTRPVPVLAEAAVLAAGSARMPVLPLAIASSVANLAVSCVYAYAGASGAPGRAGVSALGLALLLPLLAWCMAYALRRFKSRADL